MKYCEIPVNISYSNYRTGPTVDLDEKETNNDEEKDLDRFVVSY